MKVIDTMDIVDAKERADIYNAYFSETGSEEDVLDLVDIDDIHVNDDIEDLLRLYRINAALSVILYMIICITMLSTVQLSIPPTYAQNFSGDMFEITPYRVD